MTPRDIAIARGYDTYCAAKRCYQCGTRKKYVNTKKCVECTRYLTAIMNGRVKGIKGTRTSPVPIKEKWCDEAGEMHSLAIKKGKARKKQNDESARQATTFEANS